MKKFNFILLLFGFLLLIFSCHHDPIYIYDLIPSDTTGTDTTGTDTTGTDTTDTDTIGIVCDPDSVYFQNDILPIIISNCAKPGCHDGSGEEMVLNSYNTIIVNGEVVPGQPNESKIFEAITEGGEDQMPPPPDAPLTDDQIDMIYKWISQGAKNNHCDAECDTVNVTFSQTIFPLIEKNCIGCHSGSVIAGGIDLSNYNNIYQQVLNGNLYGSINHLSGYTAMPPGGQLSDCEIKQINLWIDNGAPNN